MSPDSEKSQFIPVDIESLKVGSMVDRPLYIQLQKLGRYVRLLKPFMVLAANTYEKFRKSGRVYSIQESIDKRYPELGKVVQSINTKLSDEKLTPYEKSAFVKKDLATIFTKVFKNTSAADWNEAGTGLGFILSDGILGAVFVQRLLNTPDAEPMIAIENASVQALENSIQAASVAALFAMMLDYCDKGFLQYYVNAVFCAEMKALGCGDELLGKLVDPRFADLIKPSLSPLKSGSFNDELCDLAEFSRWIVRTAAQGDAKSIDPMPKTRIYRKLIRIVDATFGTDSVKQEAAA